MIDLRSDTITVPSDGMREAIANAVVGDDVYHDDPTVNELEETVASILGTEDAMFVPTGTMSNQIAVRMHTQPGDSVVLESNAHIAIHEMGGAAHNSGVTLKRIEGRNGMFSGDDLRREVPVQHPSLPPYLFEPYTLMCLENTHNAAGGTIWDLDVMADVTAAASQLGIARHLDGARLWNASVAAGIPEAAYASLFDTVSVCFSKGLGAPVGSALAGDTAFVAEARRFKQMFGGGFRQAGLLAAGALFALANNRDRLEEDHGNTRRFAEAIADAKGADVDLEAVQTNIVYFDVADPGRVVDESLDDGVSMLVDGSRVRAVFHLGVSADATARAIDIVTAVVSP